MSFSGIPIVHRAAGFSHKTAIIAKEGTFTYKELLDASHRVASCLLAGTKDLNEARVAFLLEPGFVYASVMWGIWRAGGIAVPLSPSHPKPELEYVIADSEASCLVCEPTFQDRLHPIAAKRGIRLITTFDALSEPPGILGEIDPARRAMILYTSGTTSKPKGVVSTHLIITAQIESIVEAWEWSQDDRTLLVLPLHHLHGILNVLSCALWSGAIVETLQRFDAERVWKAIASGRLTIFMAVPTIYSRLIAFWESSSPEMRKAMSDGARRMRVMISGSAPLPVPILERWKEITGHTLLERYGMTEIG
ncbi:MAG: AMP-binding protein, partial [Candidatus Caldarchaeum sp.]